VPEGRVLVTGAAGFIGSHLTERLRADGVPVVALDRRRGPHLAPDVVGDLLRLPLVDLVRSVSCVFHLAGRPGVRDSWGADFASYARNNLLATQRLAEAAVAAGGTRIVFASTSSVYGDAPMPFREDGPTRPISPYGVSKLACEALLRAYARVCGLPVIVLRYFTVYGPRQRPDMAFARWMAAVRRGRPISLYGGGSRRDFTYVGDAVDATVRAGAAPAGRTYNVASGRPVPIEEPLRIIGALAGRQPRVIRLARPAGDPPATWAHMGAAAELGYLPRVGLAEGLRAQWEATAAGG
jgi:UDP-glucuronate 4-epimerase